MKDNVNPYSGIHKKVLNKTRIIKRFIWFKHLEGKLKFLESAYIFQRCLKNQLGVELSKTSEKYLDWSDIKYTVRHHTFLKCDCENELTTSGSFLSDNNGMIKYRCTDCKTESLWNFNLGPVITRIRTNQKND